MVIKNFCNRCIFFLTDIYRYDIYLFNTYLGGYYGREIDAFGFPHTREHDRV